MPAADPLTVVIVVDHANVTGGQTKVALESARGLKRAGHRPIVFAAVGPLEPAFAAEDIEIVCLDQPDILNNPSRIQAAAQGLWNFGAAVRLQSLLASLPRENSVVHVHGWAKALSPSIARPIANSALPAVYTIHEYFLFCPNGGFYNYQTHQACALEPMSAACLKTNCDSRSYAQKLWRTARQVVMQRVALLPTVFGDYITISKFQLEIIGNRLPKTAHLHNVSNPIDCVDLGPKLRPASGDFVFVGRIAQEKGPLLFAEASRRAGVASVFVGDGPAVPELRARFPEAKILGWKGSGEVSALMRAARALVFPSLWYEGQPLTVMEAKALGTPVVVSDACAGREEIEDGVAGRWFASGDAGSLAEALTALKDDSVIEALSAGAYQSFWSNPPTLARHVAGIVDVYRQMLARGRQEMSAA